MNTCEVKQILEEALLCKISLNDFAKKISLVWPKDGLFEDPLRKSPDQPMNQTLFNILEYIFESADIYEPKLAEEGVVNIIGDEEFRKDILTTYKNLIIFIHDNPKYQCDDQDQIVA